MTINVLKPEGNIFCILGVFQTLVKQLEKSGCDVTEHRKLLSEAPSHTYDELLDSITRLTNGTIKFSGRGKRVPHKF